MNSNSTKDKRTKNIYLSVFVISIGMTRRIIMLLGIAEQIQLTFLNLRATGYAYYLLRDKVDRALLALSPVRLPLSFTEPPNCGFVFHIDWAPSLTA